MKRLGLLGLIAGLFLLVTACGGDSTKAPTSPAPTDPPPTTVPTEALPAGERLFIANGCGACHGGEAQGAGNTGPRLGPNPVPFARFSSYIRQPTGNMPPYTAQVVTVEDLADIYAFLESIPDPPSADSVLPDE